MHAVDGRSGVRAICRRTPSPCVHPDNGESASVLAALCFDCERGCGSQRDTAHTRSQSCCCAAGPSCVHHAQPLHLLICIPHLMVLCRRVSRLSPPTYCPPTTRWPPRSRANLPTALRFTASARRRCVAVSCAFTALRTIHPCCLQNDQNFEELIAELTGQKAASGSPPSDDTKTAEHRGRSSRYSLARLSGLSACSVSSRAGPAKRMCAPTRSSARLTIPRAARLLCRTMLLSASQLPRTVAPPGGNAFRALLSCLFVDAFCIPQPRARVPI
jgi:hypothetical protein